MPKKGDIRADGFIFNGWQWSSPEAIERRRAYRKANRYATSRLGGNDSGKITAACELLVRADLSRRGYEVTVPVSPTAIHDLHVELFKAGWKGVQVRAGQINKQTGRLYDMHSSRGCKSPILALVYATSGFIQYRPGTEPLPEELA